MNCVTATRQRAAKQCPEGVGKCQKGDNMWR